MILIVFPKYSTEEMETLARKFNYIDTLWIQPNIQPFVILTRIKK